MRDSWDDPSSPRRRPPYAKDSTGIGSTPGAAPAPGGPRQEPPVPPAGVTRQDRWRDWDTDPDAGFDDEEEPILLRLGRGRRGPIVVGLAIVAAVTAGIWLAWPGQDPPAGPAAGSRPPAPAPATSAFDPGVESPPPPPIASVTTTGPSPAGRRDRRTAAPPPPRASASRPPSPSPSRRTTSRPTRRPVATTGPTAPPPPPSSRPPGRPSSRPTATRLPDTGPTAPPPPPGG
ncbi:hypothetical protein Sru01_47810 [Sphaerisporangium rufum]|uniref:Uncharacterized protein n=1 Tax=Sphaerisporangium rufum TaxID=1381558 RepID=A0A919V1J4_9ACTN|nr:hypothetical protein [Sphaerisporangium rufum]GII79799.1 hypothetical protein Sru01_47810 [Sphaerisporangium rufum]